MVTTGIKKRSIVLYITILSLFSPFGVIIGIVVTAHVQEASGSHLLAIAILQGLAAGTLLYVTFYEVLASDKLKKYGMGGLVGALGICLGVLLMVSLEAGSGGHSHGGGGHAGHAGHAGGVHDLHDHHGNGYGHGGHSGIEESGEM